MSFFLTCLNSFISGSFSRLSLSQSPRNKSKMLSSSNPTTIEWLITDIVYFGKQNSVFKEYAVKNFNKISLYHHYKSMCKNNYLKYLKSGASLTYKKYLYTFRGLVNAKWVAHKKSLPPIIFTGAL